jgi:hypothetical protein
MKIEYFIYIAIAVLSILSVPYIPKEKIKKALLSLLTFQTSTWFTSIMLVERNKITYPIREFTKATSVNFIPQFIFYPTIFMWFILLFPHNKNLAFKILHYMTFVSIMVWFIYFAAKYTNINKYTTSLDYYFVSQAYFRNFIQYAICHLYTSWFFKEGKFALRSE